MIPIVPALIPKDAAEVRSVLATLGFVSEVHLDVVDGQFVPFTSWPYIQGGSPQEVQTVTDRFTLEVDLMVEDPTTAGAAWIRAGADMLVFHVESIGLALFRSFVEAAPRDVSISISALNDTPIETLLPYLPFADGVQLMGIAKIGSQGQAFDERVLGRLAVLRRDYPNHPLTVDGSVNKDSIQTLVQAGAHRLICGSAIVKADEPEAAYQRLLALANAN
jgi:ribulose-phosphate 3-epimerase